MTRFDIITCLPRLLDGPFSDSILKRAQAHKIVDIHIHDLRDFADNKHRQIDDYAYGGGAGMVLKAPPIARCIDHLIKQREYEEVIYTTPDGTLFDQPTANKLSLNKNMIILCGHYKGVDERIREKYITSEISIGNYVLSGGELAAAILVDAITRLKPGALSDETSALTDSFQDNLLAPPVYTRPVEFMGMKVPDILLSGHQKAIDDWRMEKSIKRTHERRPDLLDK